MRVIAGEFRGHRLCGPGSGATRPTADKVREALFSMLGDIAGARALDVFAGTGALGIEALSRGAAAATFVERDRRALSGLRANLDATVLRRAAAGDARAEVIGADARRALELLARQVAGGRERFDLVFVDPPYAEAGRMAPWLGDLLPKLVEPRARIVVECDRRQPLRFATEPQESLPRAIEREYGDTLIRIVTLEGDEKPETE